MPGIRIEGQPRPTLGPVPPGMAPAESQLAQALGGDPFSGLNLAQLGALQAGGAGMSDNIRQQMQAHAQRNMAATSAAVSPSRMGPFGAPPSFIPPTSATGYPAFIPPGMAAPGAWNPASRGAYPNARYDESNRAFAAAGMLANANAENRNRDYMAGGMRANANYENRDRDFRTGGLRANANYENRDRDMAATQSRREAEYENRDRELARARMHRLDYEVRQEATYENKDRDLAAARERRQYDDMRRMADYENRDRDLAHNRMRKDADQDNSVFDRAKAARAAAAAAPFGAYGALSGPTRADSLGGGGGSRGGGGSGGGGTGGADSGSGSGGAMALGGHIGGLIGLPSAGRLIGGGFGGGLGAAGAVGLSIAAAREAYMLPAQFASFEEGHIARAATAMQLEGGVAAAAQGGSFSGPLALRSIYPGGLQTPPWMRALGISPGRALGLVQGLGVSPTSSEDFEGSARALGSVQFMPGLGGAEQPVLNSVSNAARYGLVQPNEGSIRSYTAGLQETLTTAVQRGMDRATILRSIDAGIAMAARTGTGAVSSTGIQDFMMRFTNLPGGMTGEAGLAAMGGLQGSMEQVGRAPLQTMMAAQAARGLRTEDDVKKFLGSRYADLSAKPEGRQAIANLLSANRSGNQFSAAMWLTALTDGDPDAQRRILSQSPFYAGMSADMRPLAEARATGMSPMAVLAANNPGNPGRTGSPVGFNFGPGGLRDTTGSDADYKAKLLRMGVRGDLVDVVISEARKHNVSPILMGGVMMKESSGGRDPRAGDNVMQIDPSSGMPVPQSAAQSIQEGAEHLDRDLARGGGNFYQAMRGYNGPAMPTSYAAAVAGFMGAGSGNVPGYLGAAADAGQGSVAGSVGSMAELEITVPAVNRALAGLITAAEKAAAALRLVPASGSGAPSAQPSAVPN